MTAVHHRITVCSGLQQVGGRGWAKDGLLRRLVNSGRWLEVVLIAHVLFVVFVIIIVLAFGPFIVTFQVVIAFGKSEALASALGLHTST